MKTNNYLRYGKLLFSVLLAGTVLLSSCKKDDDEGDDPGTPGGGKDVVEVEGTLTGNVTWTSDKVYLLKGFVRVGSDNGSSLTAVQSTGTLTIEPGTLILGDTETKGTLVVQRGSKIIAEGTAANPIVFTSEQPIGLRTPGDWGGVVICGFARNNKTMITGQTEELEGNYGAFHGGNDDSDDSGVLKYVRIEYAGIPINPNEEVNSLTMGSVGADTEMDYIQCSFGLDDAFEWFGGSSDAKHLVAFRGLDDDLDVDMGHNGRVQYAFCVRSSQNADQSGSNGFEVDGADAGDPSLFTQSVFANITILGAKKTRETPISGQFQHAAQLRRSSHLRIYNSVFSAYPMGIYIDGTGSTTHAQNDDLQLRNCYIAGVEGWGGNGWGSAYDENATFNHGGTLNGSTYPDVATTGLPFLDGGGVPRGNHPNSEPRGHAVRWNQGAFDAIDWITTPAYGNEFYADYTELGINPGAFDLGSPQLLPEAGSLLLTGADWTNTPLASADPFFDQVPYAGAFGATDWTAGWTEWNPGIAPY